MRKSRCDIEGWRAVLALLAIAAVLPVIHGTPAYARDPDTDAVPSVEAFAALPPLNAVILSPSGRHLAALRPRDGYPRVAVWTPGGDGDPVLVDAGEDRVFWMEWADDDRLLVGVGHYVPWETRGRLVRNMLVVDRTTGEVSRLLGDRGRAGRAQFRDLLVHVLPDRPGEVLVAADLKTPGHPGVYRVDLTDGRMRRVVRARPPITHWLADQDGRVRVGVGFKGRRKQVYIRSAGGRWRLHASPDVFDDPVFEVVGIDPDNARQVYAISDHETGRQALYVYDTADRAFTQRLFGHPLYDMRTVISHPRTGQPLAVRYVAEGVESQPLDPRFAAARELADTLLPGTRNRLVHMAASGTAFVVLAARPDTPNRYFLLRPDSQELRPLDGEASGQDGLGGTVTAVTYPARDGVHVPAFLTVPKGADPTALPAVVLPHGGPVRRDALGYNAMVQFLASRGYAVLQPNFRGSSGYGRAYKAAGYNQWGRLMQDDVTDAARWLIDTGVADPQRLCVVGGSYGGYVALMGTIVTPDLFRCAISINGVADLPLLIRNLSLNRFRDLSVPRISGGLSDEAVQAVSPYHRAEEVAVPVLLIHGDRDASVSYRQSVRFADRLAELGKPVDVIRLPGGGHTLREQAHRITVFMALERFLHEHIGPPGGGDARAGRSTS